MIPVLWHHSDGFWDCALPRYILNNAGTCYHFSGHVKETPVDLRALIGVIVIPGRHSCGDYDILNDVARRFDKVLWIIAGDEEGIFHSDELKHPNQRKWWFMPPFANKQQIDVALPNGWTTDAPALIAKAREKFPKRIHDWSFYGQMTHIRRVQCVDALQEIPNGDLLVTPGFTQGVSQEKYFESMVQSKFVPCPAGPCTPDSFRFAEALEAGCVPIADNLIQHSWFPPGYWDYVIGDGPKPFRVIENWRELPQIIATGLPHWEIISRRCFEWWTQQKHSFVEKMKKELEL